ncbi:hypothetical protein [Allomuricauda sp. M10]|uniref:hypothetical protein n=1 Tax=Allomuricauda sp. M10 TaxID=2683292 RepID=UPI001D193A02|nr:hypothetical protein [Muricauda sp. M10]
MKSHFKADLSKEKQLTPLLDYYYKNRLKHCSFERVDDLKLQKAGVDLILTDQRNHSNYYVDEKAQLDYVNECLPTFAFELFYRKNGKIQEGWFLDESKKTHFYALVTSIFSDEEDVFTSCNITFVNREKLTAHLSQKGLTRNFLREISLVHKNLHGKMELKELHPKKEGYLFFSTQNKAEKPINLILKLDFLEKIRVVKRLV